MDLRAWNLSLRSHQPLVVINACDSVAYTPDQFESLLKMFCDRGAAGVIGTQCPIYEPLAVSFVQTFLRDFINRIPAGQAMYNARRALLFSTQFDPRGLAYSLFASADVQLAQSLLP